MKNYPILLFLLVFLIACQPTEKQEGSPIPDDLPGKKAFLKEKKAELRALNQMIAQVEAEIENLIPEDQKIKPAVTVLPVESTDFKRYVDIQATVQSDDLVNVSSEVGGRLLQLTVQEGGFVKKGQLVASLDLEQIDKQIAELQTALQLANDIFERRERLWKQKIGSELQYLEAKNNKQRLEKSLETLVFQKNKSEIFAPISGIVEQEFLKQGEISSPGMPIIQILNTSRVKVVADVPESYLKMIRIGELVSITFPALDQETKARVSQLGRTIDPSNRTFKVEVEIPNRNGILKPNLLAAMQINDFSANDVIAIPLELIQQEVSGKDYVFIVGKEDNKAVAKKSYVVTGPSYQGKIIIENGLEKGAQLINEGARGLTDGQPIMVKDNATVSTFPLTER